MPSVDSEALIAAIRATFPEDPNTAIRIATRESGLGTHPRTFDTSAPNGGIFQINKASWADFFAVNYGWTWSQVVTDIAIHLRAARIIYDRNGWWAWQTY